MEQQKYASLEENVSRAMFYLELAVNQCRIVDAKTARTIETIHIPALLQQFDNVLDSTASNASSLASSARKNGLVSLNGPYSEQSSQSSPPFARGFDSKLINEPSSASSSEAWLSFPGLGQLSLDDTPRASSFPSASRASQHDANSSGVTSQSSRSLLAQLCEDSEPWTALTPADSIIGTPPKEKTITDVLTASPGVERNSPEVRRRDSVLSLELTRAPTTSSTGADQASPQVTGMPTSSWAGVASLRTATSATEAAAARAATVAAHFAGHLLPAGSTPTPMRRPTSTKSTSLNAKEFAEPLEAQYRCLWLGNLEEGTTLHDISRRITTGGSLMSIMLCHEVTETLPGLSCCIIFEKAEDAHTFLCANTTHGTANKAGMTLPSFPPEPIPHPAKLFEKIARHAYIIPGAPYPKDSDIVAMSTSPSYARRRLKFTRRSLFRDVDIRVFKRDILQIGGPESNVEFWHFYNSGECTIVFASVRVAIEVLNKFRSWTRPFRTGAGVAGGREGLGKVDAATLKRRERYQDVECSFAHDLNETPGHQLFSCFQWEAEAEWETQGKKGKSARYRYISSSTAKEGLWQGPPAME